MRESDGTARLEPDQEESAASGVKAMISFGRPFLDYVLSALADAGIAEVCLVIGPEHRGPEHYAGTAPRGGSAWLRGPAGAARDRRRVPAAEEFAGR
jgi:glucose-1-phosphate thymidylyltransferase